MSIWFEYFGYVMLSGFAMLWFTTTTERQVVRIMSDAQSLYAHKFTKGALAGLFTLGVLLCL